jgi:hypothetical protein
MPKKADHAKARAKLAVLAPETLHAITVRLPAGLLVDMHQWAERKGLDLAAAIRKLTGLGLEAAAHPGQAAAGDPRTVKKWGRAVERALQAGRSPLEPFLAQEAPDADLDALPAILAKLDYQSVYKQLKENLHQNEPWVEQVWQRLKERAPSHVERLMGQLDNLEQNFLARKKLRDWGAPGDDDTISRVHWLLADAVMQRLQESPPDDAEVEAVRKLIAARYLVADNPNTPWEFAWDE